MSPFSARADSSTPPLAAAACLPPSPPPPLCTPPSSQSAHTHTKHRPQNQPGSDSLWIPPTACVASNPRRRPFGGGRPETPPVLRGSERTAHTPCAGVQRERSPGWAHSNNSVSDSTTPSPLSPRRRRLSTPFCAAACCCRRRRRRRAPPPSSQIAHTQNTAPKTS